MWAFVCLYLPVEDSSLILRFDASKTPRSYPSPRHLPQVDNICYSLNVKCPYRVMCLNTKSPVCSASHCFERVWNPKEVHMAAGGELPWCLRFIGCSMAPVWGLIFFFFFISIWKLCRHRSLGPTLVPAPRSLEG